jgi:hypothetical protein
MKTVELKLTLSIETLAALTDSAAREARSVEDQAVRAIESICLFRPKATVVDGPLRDDQLPEWIGSMQSGLGSSDNESIDLDLAREAEGGSNSHRNAG